MGHDLPCGKPVVFVEHVNPGQLSGPQFGDEALHHLGLELPLRVGHVDDVKQQIGILQLLQRGLEGLHQLVGELADEAHRVGEQDGAGVGNFQRPGGGVQGVEEAVVGRNTRPGEAV